MVGLSLPHQNIGTILPLKSIDRIIGVWYIMSVRKHTAQREGSGNETDHTTGGAALLSHARPRVQRRENGPLPEDSTILWQAPTMAASQHGCACVPKILGDW